MKIPVKITKIKIARETYVQSCFTLLASDKSDMEKLTELMDYANQFEVATDMEIFNEHKT